MAFYIIRWLYMWLLPIGSLVAALIGITIYLWYKKSRVWMVLAVVTLLFYGLSIPPVSTRLIQPLENRYIQRPVQEVQGDVIILLGGGARAGVPDVDGVGQVGEAAANRFLTAVRLQKMLHVPIILSGGAVLPGDAQEATIEQRMLLSLGVPQEMIFLDTKSRNTAENARFSKALCAAHGWNHPIVVTSAFHMPRAMQFFQNEQLDVTAYPSDYRSSATERLTPFSFVPQSYELMSSCLALKEYVGLIGAKWKLQ